MEREVCGYSSNLQRRFGSGVVNPALPVTSSIAPTHPKTAAPSNPLPSRVTPSYHDAAVAATPATLLTSAGDEVESLESPSNSLTSSPASSAIQTPPSNVDRPDRASVVVPGAHASGGILGTAKRCCAHLYDTKGDAAPIAPPIVEATWGIVDEHPAIC